MNKKTVKSSAIDNEENQKEIISYKKPEYKIVPQKRSNKPLKVWIKEVKGSYSVSRMDICYIYRNIIFAKSFGELKYIIENEEIRDSYPVIVITIIASVLGDVARGNNLNLTRMLQTIFPNAMKGFDPEEFSKKTEQNNYDELLELENTLRRLEGDDSILIVDKLLMAEGDYEVVNKAD